MTESEAKKKWCPFTRYVGTVDGNVKAYHGDPTVCIASDCMAWRATDNETLPQPPEYTGEVQSFPAGYCGLAGKP